MKLSATEMGGNHGGEGVARRCWLYHELGLQNGQAVCVRCGRELARMAHLLLNAHGDPGPAWHVFEEMGTDVLAISRPGDRRLRFMAACYQGPARN
jgi:hypothetical protein